MADESNMSKQEKEDIQRAIKLSLETETPIKSNCNNSKFYLQNKGHGDCLFESVAQIFYPIDIRDHHIRDPKNKYYRIDLASRDLRTMVHKFYEKINFFEGFPADPDLAEKTKHALDINTTLVWATNEDLQILSYLLEFNYEIVYSHKRGYNKHPQHKNVRGDS